MTTDKNTNKDTQLNTGKAKLLIEIAGQDSFYNVPSSPATDIVMQTLGTNGDVKKLDTTAKQSRNRGQYTLMQNGLRRLIEYKKDDNNTISIEITDVDKLIGSRKGVKKMFLYSLVAINQQAYSVDADTKLGVLRQDYITFPLKELVDAGLYGSIQSARVGFNTARDALTSLKIKGKQTTTKGKKRTVSIDALEVMFTGGNIENGQCTLFINDRIDWGFIARFYTVIPAYCFSLKLTAFDLVYYIFYLARQNIDKIAQQGYFTISLKAVHARLGLPAIEGNRKPNETIKEPIEQAITEIEEKTKDSGFTITPVYDEAGSVKDYIEQGYLKIGLAGAYAQRFVDLATDKAELIDKAIKKKERIEEKAIAQALSKKLEKDSQ